VALEATYLELQLYHHIRPYQLLLEVAVAATLMPVLLQQLVVVVAEAG
jgi:hypothetical protein